MLMRFKNNKKSFVKKLSLVMLRGIFYNVLIKIRQNQMKPPLVNANFILQYGG